MAAIPPQAVHAPMAAPRSRCENAPTMIASELGVTRAPAAPWSARAAINVSIVGATARDERGPERRNADREHTTFAVDVSERSTDQDQRRERQEVRVRHPLLAGEAASEIASIAGSATLTIDPSIVATPEPRIAASSVSLCLRVTSASC